MRVKVSFTYLSFSEVKPSCGVHFFLSFSFFRKLPDTKHQHRTQQHQLRNYLAMAPSEAERHVEEVERRLSYRIHRDAIRAMATNHGSNRRWDDDQSVRWFESEKGRIQNGYGAKWAAWYLGEKPAPSPPPVSSTALLRPGQRKWRHWLIRVPV